MTFPAPRNKKATGRQVAGTGGALHAVHGSIQTGERQECHHRQSQADANCADAGDEGKWGAWWCLMDE